MLRLYNAKILMPDMSIENGEIVIDNGIITYVGDIRREFEYTQEIDIDKNLVMPGFKNLHTHSAMTFLRSYAEDLPLDRWLNEKIFPAEDRLTEEDAYYCCILAIMEYLTSGITTCFDMYFYPDAMARASVDTGFRTVLSGTLNNFKESLDILKYNYNKYNNFDPLVSYKLGFHAEYTTDIELLKGLAELSHKLNASVSAHVCETENEVTECIKRHGKTPVEFFSDLGLSDIPKGIYHHCVWLTDRDIDILKKHDITVVTNGGSNCKLASGIAPLERLDKANIRLALGTDSAASNNCLDMFREMWLATALQKQQTQNAAAFPAKKVLMAATSNGAEALGIDAADISVGRMADLTVIDMHRPNMQPENDVINNLVYSGSKENVLMTIVDGKILYERNKGFNIGFDEKEIYAKIADIADRILR